MSEASTEVADGGEPARRCRCGHARGDFWVRPSYTFGFWGTLAQVFGVTARPTRVDFECGVCGETVETVDDARELERLRPGPR